MIELCYVVSDKKTGKEVYRDADEIHRNKIYLYIIRKESMHLWEFTISIFGKVSCHKCIFWKSRNILQKKNKT